MSAVEKLITDHLDIWSSAIKTKSSAGRGNSKKTEVYGIKKLRELILELAVRGLLVPQDSNDEPASELLKRITVEKVRLVNEGKIKKQKQLAPIENDENSIEFPIGWESQRFGSLLDFSGGSQPPKSTFSQTEIEGYVQLIQIRDLGLNPQPVFVPKEAVSKFCTENDVMIGRYGASVGKVFWGKDGAYNVALIKLHNDYGSYINRFLYLLMRSPLGQSLFSGISRSAQAGFSKGDIENRILPLPPIEEQSRIVAKVDELMVLCDQLEQQQESSISAHKTLVQTLLGALTSASEWEGFAAAWARIAEHFDTLFTTEWSIDQLKQTILQLAVMGKLVPQDPSDEPASSLIDKIIETRDRLVKEEGLRTKASLEIDPAEEYVDNPDGWAVCRLGNLAKFIDYRGRTPKKIESGVPLITAKNVRFGYISRQPEEFISAEDFGEWMTRGFPRVGDILFTTEAPLGNVALVDIEEKFALAQRVICFQFHEPLIAEYLRLLIMSAPFQDQLIDKATGMTATGIKSAKLKEVPVPIPPLNEQRRIAAKVDDLMATCDNLKSQINSAQKTQLKLADAMATEVLH